MRKKQNIKTWNHESSQNLPSSNCHTKHKHKNYNMSKTLNAHLSLSLLQPQKKENPKKQKPICLSLSLEAFRDRWQCSGFWCVTAWSHSWFWFHFSAGSGLSFRGLSSNAFTSFLPSAPTITSCTPFLSHNRFCSIAIPP